MSRTKKKPYTGSKAIDSSCRNHRSCPWCENKRTHKNERRKPVQENTRFFRSLSDSPDPAKAELESEIAAQKAAFFASGGKAEQIQPGETAETYLNRRQMNQEAWRLSQVSEKRAARD